MLPGSKCTAEERLSILQLRKEGLSQAQIALKIRRSIKLVRNVLTTKMGNCEPNSEAANQNSFSSQTPELPEETVTNTENILQVVGLEAVSKNAHNTEKESKLSEKMQNGTTIGDEQLSEEELRIRVKKLHRGGISQTQIALAIGRSRKYVHRVIYNKLKEFKIDENHENSESNEEEQQNAEEECEQLENAEGLSNDQLENAEGLSDEQLSEQQLRSKIKKMHQEGISQTQIALKIGRSRKYVHKVIYNKPSSMKHTPQGQISAEQLISKVKKLHREGKSQKEIALQVGRSQRFVYKTICNNSTPSVQPAKKTNTLIRNINNEDQNVENELRSKIKKMHREGISQTQIALKMGCSRKYVHKVIYNKPILQRTIKQVKRSKAKIKIQKNSQEAVKLKPMSAGFCSNEERLQIKTMAKEGITQKNICLKLGRSKRFVTNILHDIVLKRPKAVTGTTKQFVHKKKAMPTVKTQIKPQMKPQAKPQQTLDTKIYFKISRKKIKRCK